LRCRLVNSGRNTVLKAVLFSIDVALIHVMRKFCLACDLKNEDRLINAYDTYHREVWPEIQDSLKRSGIIAMEIYRTGNRLFMILGVTDEFSFEKKAAMDLANPIVQKWESLMSAFQQQIPWAPRDVKWVLMDRVFNFEAGEI
jgi:L-rhamnose mutarotase